jgi:hypothetical protein
MKKVLGIYATLKLETARSYHNGKDPNPPLMRASVLLDG